MQEELQSLGDENYSLNLDSSNAPIYMNYGLKEGDSAYGIIRRKINGKTKIIEYYKTSYIPDTRIRNAVNGIRYTNDTGRYYYMVGSKEEDILFKVRIATGECGKEAITLFYDGPSQFEKHQGIQVSDSIKEKWKKKNNEYRLQKLLEK